MATSIIHGTPFITRTLVLNANNVFGINESDRTLSPTSKNYGDVATKLGIPGLTNDKIRSLSILSISVSPASMGFIGTWGDNVWFAASQSCLVTYGSSLRINITYQP